MRKGRNREGDVTGYKQADTNETGVVLRFCPPRREWLMAKLEYHAGLGRTLGPALLTSSAMYQFLIFQPPSPPRLFLKSTNINSCLVHLSQFFQFTCTVPYTGNARENKQTIPDLIKCTAWRRKAIGIKAHPVGVHMPGSRKCWSTGAQGKLA